MTRRNWLSVFVILAVAFTAFNLFGGKEAVSGKKPRLLYITTTAGFHHSACEYSVPIIKKMAEESEAFEVVASDKLDRITPQGLKDFDAIVFSNTSGDLPLSEENRIALIDSIKGGKAFIGIHAATDTYKNWAPFYEMIGGSFIAHPWNEPVTITIEDPVHPAASPVPSPWVVHDEIYTFRNYSRDKLHVIMSLDNSKLKTKGNRDDGDYAMAWCKDHGKGKVFYTALGHRHELWDDPIFQNHLLGGIRWALGQVPAKLSTGHAKVETTKWVKIFDGENLNFGSEWVTTDNMAQTKKHWTVQPGGILQGKHVEGTPDSSHLYYIKKKFRNFEYRADVCINPGGNSGMYFRCLDNNLLPSGKWKNWPNGYEAQVNNDSADPRRSGTLYPDPTINAADLERIIGYNVEKEKKNLDYWFNQHIILVGDHVVVKLNGKVATEQADIHKIPDKPYSTEGYFSFQFHDPGTVVKYKNIEVRELPD